MLSMMTLSTVWLPSTPSNIWSAACRAACTVMFYKHMLPVNVTDTLLTDTKSVNQLFTFHTLDADILTSVRLWIPFKLTLANYEYTVVTITNWSCLDQHSCSMLGPVNTAMVKPLCMGKPSRQWYWVNLNYKWTSSVNWNKILLLSE